MDEDEDVPPTLVQVLPNPPKNVLEAQSATQSLADLKISKVPLTIITGGLQGK